MSSRKFQAGVCRESEGGNARDTRRCLMVDGGEKGSGNGAVNENVEAEGRDMAGSTDADIAAGRTADQIQRRGN